MPASRALAPPLSLPGSDLWHRALRVLARLRLRLRLRRPAPARLSRPAQLRALLEVLEETVNTQQRADEAVAACGEPGLVSGQAAQDCGRAGSAFHRLRGRLRELPITEPDLAELPAYAGRLLAYDLGAPPDEAWGRMVRQSLDLAFTVHPDARTEAARLQINGLGRPADDPRRLREALRNGTPPQRQQPSIWGESNRL